MIPASEANEQSQKAIENKKEAERQKRLKTFEYENNRFVQYIEQRTKSIEGQLKKIEQKIEEAIQNSNKSITFSLPEYRYDYFEITNKDEYIESGYKLTKNLAGKDDPLFIGVINELQKYGYKVITEVKKTKEYVGRYDYEGGQIDAGPQYYVFDGEYVDLIISW